MGYNNNNVIIIIPELFIKRKILSVETILSAVLSFLQVEGTQWVIIILIIILEVFVKRKILSIETTLSSCFVVSASGRNTMGDNVNNTFSIYKVQNLVCRD